MVWGGNPGRGPWIRPWIRPWDVVKLQHTKEQHRRCHEGTMAPRMGTEQDVLHTGCVKHCVTHVPGRCVANLNFSGRDLLGMFLLSQFYTNRCHESVEAFVGLDRNAAWDTPSVTQAFCLGVCGNPHKTAHLGVRMDSDTSAPFVVEMSFSCVFVSLSSLFLTTLWGGLVARRAMSPCHVQHGIFTLENLYNYFSAL